MTGLELAAVVAVAVWLVVATVVMILLVRQVGLLTLRADRADEGPRLDGISVGRDVPEAVSALLPGVRDRANVLILGATCGPCRELVDNLAPARITATTVAVIEGDEAAAEGVASRLPSGIRRVTGARAAAAMKALDLQTTPFLFLVDDGVVVGKDVVRSADHYLTLTEDEHQPALRPRDDDAMPRLETTYVG
jgi:hypothetical protein